MPTEATFLLAALLVIWAASGWAFGRFGDKDREAPPPARVNADYLRGLNLVLNRRTDEALELFLQMAKVDDETLETHFALGHLFMRRGEVERAIRVHQNLLARPNLNEAQRHQALFALAEDYLGAGLFDRAEKLFAELSDSETMAPHALRQLVYIYERERDWNNAIQSLKRLEALTGEHSSQIEHYRCELAEEARRRGDLKAAKDYLKTAARSESGALRATLIRAGIAGEEGDYGDALRLYTRVLDQDQRFIGEILPDLYACYRALDRERDFEAYVRRLITSDKSVGSDLAYGAIIGDLTHCRVLGECVEEFVLHDELLSSLIDAEELESASPEQRQATIDRIARGLRKLALSNARYRCTNCGYSTQRFIWNCPSCKQWESIRPIQRFQFESIIA